MNFPSSITLKPHCLPCPLNGPVNPMHDFVKSCTDCLENTHSELCRSSICWHILPLSKVTQSCLTVTPWSSPPGSSIHGIFLARILEWVTITIQYPKIQSPLLLSPMISSEKSLGTGNLRRHSSWQKFLKL